MAKFVVAVAKRDNVTEGQSVAVVAVWQCQCDTVPLWQSHSLCCHHHILLGAVVVFALCQHYFLFFSFFFFFCLVGCQSEFIWRALCAIYTLYIYIFIICGFPFTISVFFFSCAALKFKQSAINYTCWALSTCHFHLWQGVGGARVLRHKYLHTSGRQRVSIRFWLIITVSVASIASLRLSV